MVEGFRSREQATERTQAQLQSIANTIQSQLDQSQATEARMEAQIKQAVTGYVTAR